MAKKVVASLKKKDAVGMSKVIRAVKSKESNAYVFESTMMPNDKVQDFLKNKK